MLTRFSFVCRVLRFINIYRHHGDSAVFIMSSDTVAVKGIVIQFDPPVSRTPFSKKNRNLIYINTYISKIEAVFEKIV